jgi:hypothetical protein
MQRITKIGNNDSKLLGSIVDKLAQMGNSINKPIQDSQLEQDPQFEQVTTSRKEKASELVQEIFALSIDSEGLFEGMPKNNQLRNMMGQIYTIALDALRIIDPVNYPTQSGVTDEMAVNRGFDNFMKDAPPSNFRNYNG